MNPSIPHHPQGTFLSLIPWLITGLVLLAYLMAAASQNRSDRPWSRWRTLGFVTGCALLALGLTPALHALAQHDIRVHMVQHLLIGMFAPLGLVLAAPLTLAVRTLPAKAGRAIMHVLGSSVVHGMAHPFTALLLNIGGMYVLYLTPLYTATLENPYLHHLLHLHFLLAGYLFCWAVAGPDPAPRRPGMYTRLIALFIGMAAHAYLSKMMYAYGWPSDTPHPAEQIQAAAKLMYYGGDLAELLLAVAFFAAWFRMTRRSVASGERGVSHHPAFRIKKLVRRAPDQ